MAAGTSPHGPDRRTSRCPDLEGPQEAHFAIDYEPIHSDQPDKRGKVGRRIEDALRDRSSSEHSVVIITHEGLLGVDPTLLDGWGIAVDEVPEGGVLSDVFKAGNGWRTLADLYRLIPLSENSRWHLVMPRDDVELPTIGEVIHDTAKALVPFHKAALCKTRGVYVDMADWKDAKGTKKKVRWYSCWTPQGLAQHASSVTFAGAGVLNSLMYPAAQQAPSGPIPFEVIDISVETPRTARPKVRSTTTRVISELRRGGRRVEG
jgi:hypothetical protein